MATFIKVEQDGSELLRRNQEQAQAARLAKLEGDEQARTEKEAKRQRQAELQRQGLDASGNALGDSRRRQVFRRDEPAASLIPSFPGFSHSQIIYWRTAAGNGRWRVYSGDRSAYVESSLNYTGGSDSSLTPLFAFLMMPAGGDACIVAVYALINDFVVANPPTSTNAVRASRCYICTTKSVRQIAVPANLQRCIDLLNPPTPYDAPGPFIDNINNVTVSNIAPRTIEEAAYGWADPMWSLGTDRRYSPSIFESLNKLEQFISPSAIKQFPVNRLPVTFDFRFGFYKEPWFETDPDPYSFYYAQWLGDPALLDYQRPDLLLPLRQATLSFPSDGYPFPLPSDIIDNGPVSGSQQFLFAYDWTDPNYCRSMCLALGFSIADLLP